MSDDTDRWLLTDEVAERLRIDVTTVRKWRRDGYFTGWAKFGARKFRIRESKVAEFERAQEKAFADEVAEWAPPAQGAA